MPLPKAKEPPRPTGRGKAISERLADPSATGPQRRLEASEEDDSSLSDTHAMPRIESAIPPDPHSEEAAESTDHTAMGTRSIVLAALAALVVVGGVVLAIVHPWDPDAYSIKATTAADTSMAGFPGTISELSGQDKDATSAPSVSADDATYEQLHGDWEDLGTLASRLEAAEEGFEEAAFSDDESTRSAAEKEARDVAIEISNTIDDIDSADVSTGTYEDSKATLTKLGNWLRNQSDNLSYAWDAVDKAVSAGDLESSRSDIVAILKSQQGSDGKNTYASMFEGAYDGAEPARS